MTTNPKTNGNVITAVHIDRDAGVMTLDVGTRAGMSYAAAELTWRGLIDDVPPKLVGAPVLPPSPGLRLDYLAARAIRYELGGDPDTQHDRRQELEEASRASCAEWVRVMRPDTAEYVREGWES